MVFKLHSIGYNALIFLLHKVKSYAQLYISTLIKIECRPINMSEWVDSFHEVQ